MATDGKTPLMQAVFKGNERVFHDKYINKYFATIRPIQANEDRCAVLVVPEQIEYFWNLVHLWLIVLIFSA